MGLPSNVDLNATGSRGSQVCAAAGAQCCRGGHQIAMVPANCGQSPLPRRERVQGNARGCALAYKMIAERDNEKYSFARESRLLIVAKAKVWASEGWRVVITDQDGKAYAPPEFDRLLAA
jgi:hypothetical protein